MRSFAFILNAAVLLIATACTAQKYHVLKTFHASGNSGWDYIAVSPVTDNIYVAHGTQVNIINRNTGDSTGIIPNTDGVHGIAFAPPFNKGFTSNGRLNNVTVFNINTNAVERQIETGENPDAIMYDAFSKKVYVCNGRGKSLTVIDPDANEVVKTIPFDGKPETAVSDNAGTLFVNIEDKNEIVVVNTKTLTVTNRWKTGKGEEPSGLAIDTKTKRLFAGCGNKLLVALDAVNGKVVKELPIGDGCDGVAFDPGTKTIFSSNGDGTLTIIKERSADKLEVLQQAETKKGARTLAVDEKTHLVYQPVAEYSNEPPPPGQRRRSVLPGTFQVLVVGQ